MNEAFDAGNLTINLIGYERSSVENVVNKDNTICDVKYPVASFDPGYVQTGASEFPFSITLPKEVKEIFLLQVEGGITFSRTFFLKAQMEPREDTSPQWANQTEKISLLRADVALYFCKPADQQKPATSQLS